MRKLRIRILLILVVALFLKNGHCELEAFVVGGSYTKIKKFPHAVSLLIECPMENPIMCGSSVLNQKVLMTAAHCFETCKKPTVLAFAGHEKVEQATIIREGVNFIVHKNYDPDTVENDIALVLLKKSLPLGKKIQRVIISAQPSHAKYAIVAGWGVIDVQGRKDTEMLKFVKQKIKSTESCKKFKLQAGMMCAENIDEMVLERPAEGDSGSALITDEGQQVGIVSFLVPDHDTVIVYTNVTYFHHWIQKHSKKLFCKGYV